MWWRLKCKSVSLTKMSAIDHAGCYSCLIRKWKETKVIPLGFFIPDMLKWLYWVHMLFLNKVRLKGEVRFNLYMACVHLTVTLQWLWSFFHSVGHHHDSMQSCHEKFNSDLSLSSRLFPCPPLLCSQGLKAPAVQEAWLEAVGCHLEGSQAEVKAVCRERFGNVDFVCEGRVNNRCLYANVLPFIGHMLQAFLCTLSPYKIVNNMS